MRKLVVELTIPSLKQIIINQFEYSKAIGKLLQHKILVSDTILESYRTYFEEIDELMLFDKWFEELNRIDVFECFDSLEGENEIVVQMKKIYKHLIVITEKEKVESTIATPIILSELNNNTINTLLDWYCIPFNKIIRKGTCNSVFFDWLKDLLYDETKITIIDPYICKSENRKLFTKLLMPSIPIGAKVNLYFDGFQTEQPDITYFKKIYGDRLKMNSPSFRDDGHDRYIFCDSFVLVIGIGLDVFVFSTKVTRKETYISLTNAERPSIPAPYH